MAAMTVDRLAEGLWRWTVPHPDWREGADWGPIVGSVYWEAPEAVVLFDPLVPADRSDRDRFWAALDRDVGRLGLPVAVLLTCRWHVRSATAVRDRYSAGVWGPADDGAELDGLVTERVADTAWPLVGVQAFLTGMPGPHEEAVYWIAAPRAVVAGDVLLGDGYGGLRLARPGSYSGSAAERAWSRGRLVPSLRRLVGLEPELVLPAHGEPVTAGAGAALDAALAGT